MAVDIIRRAKRDGRDLRKAGLTSVANYDKAAKRNMIRDNCHMRTIYACACGSRKFHLEQQRDNIKAICAKCGDARIIAWNADGSIIRLDTFEWFMPIVEIKMTGKG
jgi:hypothetical protein